MPDELRIGARRGASIIAKNYCFHSSILYFDLEIHGINNSGQYIVLDQFGRNNHDLDRMPVRRSR